MILMMICCWPFNLTLCFFPWPLVAGLRPAGTGLLTSAPSVPSLAPQVNPPCTRSPVAVTERVHVPAPPWLLQSGYMYPTERVHVPVCRGCYRAGTCTHSAVAVTERVHVPALSWLLQNGYMYPLCRGCYRAGTCTRSVATA